MITPEFLLHSDLSFQTTDEGWGYQVMSCKTRNVMAEVGLIYLYCC